MTVVPNFLLKRIFIKNSLRAWQQPASGVTVEPPLSEGSAISGAAFDLNNIIGPGSILRINAFTLNDQRFGAQEIYLVMEDKAVLASTLSENNPMFFPMGQKISCVMLGATLSAQKYDVVIDLVSLEGGHVEIKVSDTVTPDRTTA